MFSSFHTHTYLCNHAEGSPLDYIFQAETESCSALGFSDHCPYPHNDIWPFCRMQADQLPFYKELIEETKKYASFPVYFGFECEWEPQYASWFQDTLIGRYGAEYLVLGSHWYPVRGEYQYVVEIADKHTLHRYIDFTIEAMQSGLFSFLAHPDLFLSNRTVIDADCIACADALIDAANAENMPLEINGYGLFKPKIERNYGLDYRYPVGIFWERAAAKNAQIICNSDAHETGHVIAGTRKAFEYAARLGITAVDSADALGFARLSEPVQAERSI
ncbi:MAG: PHP domain-containing protein [Treponema sp.]